MLTRANVIDGIDPLPILNATVIVTNGRIQRIETGSFAPPAGARVIDLEGRYLLPGLIDAHTHAASLGAVRRALESGVTTIRSSGVGNYQDVALRELAKSGAIAGPDVLATGVFVSPTLGGPSLPTPGWRRCTAG